MKKTNTINRAQPAYVQLLGFDKENRTITVYKVLLMEGNGVNDFLPLSGNCTANVSGGFSDYMFDRLSELVGHCVVVMILEDKVTQVIDLQPGTKIVK